LAVTDSVVTDNVAVSTSWAGLGGGMLNEGGSPVLTNCVFAGNSATGATVGYGGALSNVASSPTLTNCTFSDNTAMSYAGGIYNWGLSYPTLVNCILWNDVPDEIGNSGAVPSVTYSDVQGGYSGTGNIDLDPQFDADYALQTGSPAIDAGTWVGAPATDLLGIARPRGAAVDMGAYEFPAAATDSDGDGINNSDEGVSDTDGDGTPDYLDPDSDNDGISDADEGDGDSDADGTPDYVDTDSDDDGISDSDETDVDTDIDGTPDYLDLDSDDDGILDADEGGGDSDGDGTPDYLDLDSDEDGVDDSVELADGTDHARPENLRIENAAGGVADTRTGVRVEFPAGSLASPLILADITLLDSPPSDVAPGGLVLTDVMFELEPDGETFSAPVTVIVTYDNAAIRRVTERTLTVLYWDGSGYSSDGLTVVSHDRAANTLVFETSQLATFVLAGEPVPAVQVHGTPTLTGLGVTVLCTALLAGAILARGRAHDERT